MNVTKNLGDLCPPSTGEVRNKVLFAPVSLAGVEARFGRTPFAPKILFMPGYAVIRCVEMQSEKKSLVLLWGQGGDIDHLWGLCRVRYCP
jgi:hypothetical protein